MDSCLKTTWDAHTQLTIRKEKDKEKGTSTLTAQTTGKAMKNFANSNGTDTPILHFKELSMGHHTTKEEAKRKQRASSPRKQKVHQTSENIKAKFCRRCSVTTDNIKKVLCM